MPSRSATATRRETTAEIAGMRLTHPDKILYPEAKLTKRDVARYLDAVAERMLAHLAGRPVSLMRCPDGQGAACFFQRHAGMGLSEAIGRFDLKGARGGTKEYLSITDKTGLLAAAQLGVLEFHIWGVHTDDVTRPDRLVFDLDPDPTVGFAAVARAALEVRDALDALGLKSFALLTGGKGVHVVVPLARRQDWPTVKCFARALAERFVAEAPDRYVATMRKEKRKGRIFIDYFRNDLTASAIAPYSPRARAGASVAWPVSWAELAKANAADSITIKTAHQRLAKPDPWPDYAKMRQYLSAAALKALEVRK